jgi:hypothetical protein
MLKLAVKGDTMNPTIERAIEGLTQQGDTKTAKLVQLAYLIGVQDGMATGIPEGLKDAYDNERNYL